MEANFPVKVTLDCLSDRVSIDGDWIGEVGESEKYKRPEPRSPTIRTTTARERSNRRINQAFLVLFCLAVTVLTLAAGGFFWDWVWARLCFSASIRLTTLPISAFRATTGSAPAILSLITSSNDAWHRSLN